MRQLDTPIPLKEDWGCCLEESLWKRLVSEELDRALAQRFQQECPQFQPDDQGAFTLPCCGQYWSATAGSQVARMHTSCGPFRTTRPWMQLRQLRAHLTLVSV